MHIDYCDQPWAVCGRPHTFEASVCAMLPFTRWTHRSFMSPWRRAYHRDRRARWELPGANDTWCPHMLRNASLWDLHHNDARWLDMLDVALLDFLIGNVRACTLLLVLVTHTQQHVRTARTPHGQRAERTGERRVRAQFGVIRRVILALPCSASLASLRRAAGTAGLMRYTIQRSSQILRTYSQMDRHHFEYIEEFGKRANLVMLDNGKGMQTTWQHDLSVLAPLYQCCIIRRSTYVKLLVLHESKSRARSSAFPRAAAARGTSGDDAVPEKERGDVEGHGDRHAEEDEEEVEVEGWGSRTCCATPFHWTRSRASRLTAHWCATRCCARSTNACR